MGVRLSAAVRLEGDNGRGEEHRDPTGEREWGPDMKLPEEVKAGAVCMGVKGEIIVEETGEEPREEMNEPHVPGLA